MEKEFALQRFVLVTAKETKKRKRARYRVFAFAKKRDVYTMLLFPAARESSVVDEFLLDRLSKLATVGLVDMPMLLGLEAEIAKRFPKAQFSIAARIISIRSEEIDSWAYFSPDGPEDPLPDAPAEEELEEESSSEEEWSEEESSEELEEEPEAVPPADKPLPGKGSK